MPGGCCRVTHGDHQQHGHAFFVREDGRLCITPLFLVLLVVESTDVLFAVDSVPAIFGITLDPFIVFTSNIFAIMGLRALYFLLAGAIELFRVSALRAGRPCWRFVGGSMIADYWLAAARRAPGAHVGETGGDRRPARASRSWRRWWRRGERERD